MKFDTVSAWDSGADGTRVVLSKGASAVQLQTHSNGSSKLGLICQLPAGTALELCGEGYSERTVKVRYRDQFYFVFRHDLAH